MPSRPCLYQRRGVLYLARVQDEHSIFFGCGTRRLSNGKLGIDSGSCARSLFFSDGRRDETLHWLSPDEGYDALESFFTGLTTEAPEILMLKDLGYDTTVEDFGFYAAHSSLCQAIYDLPRALLEGRDIFIRHPEFLDIPIPASLFRRP